MAIYIEKDLNFTFPDSLEWEEFDKDGIKLPVGLKLVDLVIERESDILLVEIKDPSDSGMAEGDRATYLKRLQSGSVIKEDLTPKVRDSYTFLHLMERDNKKLIYIVLLGLDSYKAKIKKALLSNFKDQLLTDIKKETVLPWKRKYIEDCVVMTVDIWNQSFQEWQITRIPQSGAN